MDAKKKPTDKQNDVQDQHTPTKLGNRKPPTLRYLVCIMDCVLGATAMTSLALACLKKVDRCYLDRGVTSEKLNAILGKLEVLQQEVFEVVQASTQKHYDVEHRKVVVWASMKKLMKQMRSFK